MVAGFDPLGPRDVVFIPVAVNYDRVLEDEALLAVGFIFTIHFFNGHLRPEKFPMDPVIFTGRLAEEEFRRDHPEEYERLRAEGRLEARRAEHYRDLGKPLDAEAFTGPLREEMRAELATLEAALPSAGWLQIAARPAGAIKLTPLEAAPEPRNLRRLKTAIRARWGVVPLMDMLTETCLRTGCLNVFTPAGTQNHLDPHVLFERLLLLIYAYGTGTGIRWTPRRARAAVIT